MADHFELCPNLGDLFGRVHTAAVGDHAYIQNKNDYVKYMTSNR